ncbi:MAG: membrane biogenesis protein [Clostridia bacterium]|nr:membrane biogenesis protein [Clostridia bacterium]
MKEQIQRVFRENKPIIAMLHLSGHYQDEVQELAKREIELYYSNGVDAVLVEDYFGTARDVVWALDYLSRSYSECVYGVNLLSDPEEGFELASQSGAAFLQIDSVCGHLMPGRTGTVYDGQKLTRINRDGDYAERLAALRAKYPVFLLGGVRFKYQPIRSGRSVEEDLIIGKERCDAVVVTGGGTGQDTGMEKIQLFRNVLGDYPLIVGAGMTIDTCRDQLSVADGAIIGSWFKVDGRAENPVDPKRVRQFMDVVLEVRAGTAEN